MKPQERSEGVRLKKKNDMAINSELSKYLQANFAQPVLYGAEEEKAAEGKRTGNK